jgi:hypothetical protein
LAFGADGTVTDFLAQITMLCRLANVAGSRQWPKPQGFKTRIEDPCAITPAIQAQPKSAADWFVFAEVTSD